MILKERTPKEREAYADGFGEAINLYEHYWKRGDNSDDIIIRLRLLLASIINSQNGDNEKPNGGKEKNEPKI